MERTHVPAARRVVGLIDPRRVADSRNRDGWLSTGTTKMEPNLHTTTFQDPISYRCIFIVMCAVTPWRNGPVWVFGGGSIDGPNGSQRRA